MIFEQIVWRDLGCASYLVGCQVAGEAVVVDELPEQHGGTLRQAEVAGDHHPLHLVRALADLEDLLVAVEP